MSKERIGNRWLVVVGALLIQICLGAIYAWGTFTPALQARRSELIVMLSPKLLGISAGRHAELKAQYQELKARFDALAREMRSLDDSDAIKIRHSEKIKSLDEEYVAAAGVSPDVWERHYYGYNAKQTQMIFAVSLLTFAVVMIVAGRWQDKFGPRLVAAAGGIVLGAGYIVASMVGTGFWPIFACIGVVGGVGIGLGYVCPIAACVKWFPDMKGIITGLAVAGFGAGAFVFIKLGGEWAHLVAEHGISGTYFVFGLIFMVCVTAGALLLSNPPAGWKPAGWNPSVAQGAIAAPHVEELTQGQCIQTPQFWMIWLAFVFLSGCGLMVIGCLKDFGIREGGLSAAAAGTALGLLALFNGLGRIVWGTASQKLTARGALIAMSLLQALMMFLLLGMGAQTSTLTIAACWIGFNFGGNFALFPLLTAESFGTRNLGANYGAAFTAYGVGGILGPVLAGGIWDALHSYQWAFIGAGVACFLAMGLALMLKPPKLVEQVAG